MSGEGGSYEMREEPVKGSVVTDKASNCVVRGS